MEKQELDNVKSKVNHKSSKPDFNSIACVSHADSLRIEMLSI